MDGAHAGGGLILSKTDLLNHAGIWSDFKAIKKGNRKAADVSFISAIFRLRSKGCMLKCLRKIFETIMEQKEEKCPENKSSAPLEIISSGTTAIACASGGALLGTSLAGPIGGVIGAVASGVAGFLISGSHSTQTTTRHDK